MLEMPDRDRDIQILYMCNRCRLEAVKKIEAHDPTKSRVTPNKLKRRFRGKTDNALRRTYVRSREVGVNDRISRMCIALLVGNISHSGVLWHLASSPFLTKAHIWPQTGVKEIQRLFCNLFFKPSWPLQGRFCYGLRYHPIQLEASATKYRR